MLKILLLLTLAQSPQPDLSPKQCIVTEVVTESIRSDCGTWRPLKTEKIVMPAEARDRLRVGEVFYFVWTGDRWTAFAQQVFSDGSSCAGKPMRFYVATEDVEQVKTRVLNSYVGGYFSDTAATSASAITLPDCVMLRIQQARPTTEDNRLLLQTLDSAVKVPDSTSDRTATCRAQWIANVQKYCRVKDGNYGCSPPVESLKPEECQHLRFAIGPVDLTPK